MMTLAYVTRRADAMTARLRKLNAFVQELHDQYDAMPSGSARIAVLNRATQAVEFSEVVSNAMLFYVRQRSRLQAQ